MPTRNVTPTTALVARANIASRAVTQRQLNRKSEVHGAFRCAFRSPGQVVTGQRTRPSIGSGVPRAKSEAGESPLPAAEADNTRSKKSSERPAVVFTDAVESIVRDGLQSALSAVDERLSRAMKAEGSEGGDGGEDGALTAVKRAAEDEAQAVEVIACLKARGLIRGYGAARQVPKRDYDLAELRLNNIEAEKLLSPKETTVQGVKDNIARGSALGFCAYIAAAHPTGGQVLGLITTAAFSLAYDQVVFNSGFSNLVLDTISQSTSAQYRARLQRHEAAHFMIAYLMGILPKGYTLSSLDAFKTYGALNVQAGCAFCDSAFQQEVASGRITSSSLGRFTCVALAGIGMEYVAFGYAEGGVADVMQLDGMLKALAFSQKKSDSEVRWAVLNTITILRRHRATIEALAECMAAGESVGACIQLIETRLASCTDI